MACFCTIPRAPDELLPLRMLFLGAPVAMQAGRIKPKPAARRELCPKYNYLELLSPNTWRDYELIDCGDFLKLERFGAYTLIRPEPQAVWRPGQPMADWQAAAHASFNQLTSQSGAWEKHRPMPDNWEVKYKTGTVEFRLKLALTAFKHVGVFPEQAANWDWMANQLAKRPRGAKVLNLFAYTGAASLVAKAAGADVVHVDSVRQVVSWARTNMELSNLTDVRWTVEDAKKFVNRELKRGRKYDGIILDPPAYGLGPNGERWKLESDITPFFEEVVQLLAPGGFLILNTYSLGFSSLIIENLFRPHFKPNSFKVGELYLKSNTNIKLPLGVFGHFGG